MASAAGALGLRLEGNASLGGAVLYRKAEFVRYNIYLTGRAASI
jgi:hypothetical protein